MTSIAVRPQRFDIVRAGVPTTYKGIIFRSRLEARWAVFMDRIQWDWQYEPIDLSGYIPDFIVHFKRAKLLLEVKPALDYEELEPAGRKVALSGWNRDYLVVGSRPFALAGDPLHRSFGRLYLWDRESDDGWQPADHAMAVRCDGCRLTSMRHASAEWFCVACGTREPREYLTDVHHDEIDDLWADAGNEIQWHKP